jgi:hypothetical protein
MARDECNTEVRVGSNTFASEDAACDHIDAVQEDYPEYSSIWVEYHKDKSYYQEQAQRLYDNDQYDLY